MTTFTALICIHCARKHEAIYGKWGLFCDAFPDGIPNAIKHSEVDHRTEPVHGDHGLLFVAKSPEAVATAERIMDDSRHFRAEVRARRHRIQN